MRAKSKNQNNNNKHHQMNTFLFSCLFFILYDKNWVMKQWLNFSSHRLDHFLWLTYAWSWLQLNFLRPRNENSNEWNRSEKGKHIFVVKQWSDNTTHSAWELEKHHLSQREQLPNYVCTSGWFSWSWTKEITWDSCFLSGNWLLSPIDCVMLPPLPRLALWWYEK